jgi:hypothetical protein
VKEIRRQERRSCDRQPVGARCAVTDPLQPPRPR